MSSQAEIPSKGPPSLLHAAGLIAAVTIFSKVLGFARDWAIMYAYGSSLTSDAYFAAFQLPAFSIVLLGGLGGPFHTTTVAIFSRLLKDDGPPGEKAKLLASTFMTLTSLGFAVAALLVYLFAEPIMGFILAQADPELIRLSAEQLRIMSPCIFVGGLVGILYGLANLYHCFFWPSLSPVALSGTILVALFLFPHDGDGMLLAWATLAGAVVQLLMQVPEFLRRKFSLKPAFTLQLPELKKAGELLFPATIGTTIGQLTTYVDMFFAAMLPLGGWTAVTLSNRLMQLPIGVLQTALLVPIFPRFSRAAAEGDVADIKRNFKLGVVSLWFISLPLLVLMMLYTEPIIRLVFQHGQFDADDTRMVSLALIFQAFQIIPYFARDSITRVFYAFHDARTPLLVGGIAIVLKGILNWLLVPMFGVGGITFAITLITFINMILLGVLSKRHIQDLGFREMLSPFIRLLLAALLMAAFVWVTHGGLTMLLSINAVGARATASGWLAYGVIAFSAVVGVVFYTMLALLFKVEEVRYLQERLSGILSKLLRRKPSL